MPYKDKEKERARQERRRKTPEYKAYQREYQKKWNKDNQEKRKEIQKKSESRPERIEYRKNWWKESPKAKEIRSRFAKSEKGKKYHRDWTEANPKKVKQKQDKYQYTKKGIANQINKVQNRRNKFKKIAGVYYNRPNKELIKIINDRDKVCVYCGRDFSNDKNSKYYRNYDHLDAFKPHSIKNTVKCCGSCNFSKGEKDVWEWLKMKGYKPAKIIYDLS